MSKRPKAGASMAHPPPVELQIPAAPENVRIVRLTLTGVASRMPFTYDEVEDMKVAVAEACNNAILHSQASAGSGAQVGVAFLVHPDALEIRITDQGTLPQDDLLGNARSRAKQPRKVIADLPQRGFGLLLIQTLMDEVELYEGPSGHTTLRMVKKVQTQRKTRSKA